MNISRRNLSKLITSGVILPNTVFAQQQTTNERKFLFLFCDGGWDPTFVFAPLFGNPNVDLYGDASSLRLHNMDLVDSEQRPNVRSFFENYGQDTIIVNGIDLETVSHERGKQTLMTGSSNGLDDWGALIAASSADNWDPYLVVSGPSFTTYYPNEIVRVGKRGELSTLLLCEDAISLEGDRRAESLVNSYLHKRADGHVEKATGEHHQRFAGNYRRSLLEIDRISNHIGDLDLTVDPNNYYGFCEENFMEHTNIMLDCFEQGLIRCGIVEDYGYCGWRWDTHYNIVEQSYHFELLFTGLHQLMNELQTRRDPSGIPLIENTTIVVLSEMGRHPKINYIGGKDHWPVTSMMIIGGVDGGRTVGAYTDMITSHPIDPISGQPFANGEKLTAAHIGATLLALADTDPGEYLSAQPMLDIIK